MDSTNNQAKKKRPAPKSSNPIQNLEELATVTPGMAELVEVIKRFSEDITSLRAAVNTSNISIQTLKLAITNNDSFSRLSIQNNSMEEESIPKHAKST